MTGVQTCVFRSRLQDVSSDGDSMSGDGDDADDVNDNVSSDEDWCEIGRASCRERV